MSAIRGQIRKFIYPFADRLCVQTENIRSWYDKNMRLDAIVIPNPALRSDLAAAPNRAQEGRQSHGRRRAITLGRLEPQKGLDRLVDAFAMIHADVADWEIAIYGAGEQHAALERQIAAHKLEQRIALMGATSEPMAELAASDLYIHSARYEGYPNAVLEALAVGLCVVATDCPGATGEILDGGRYGILVADNDIGALAAGMKRAMTDSAVRADFAQRAPQALAHIAPGDVAMRWLREIENCRG